MYVDDKSAGPRMPSTATLDLSFDSNVVGQHAPETASTSRAIGLSAFQHAIKRVFDLVVVAIMLALFAPVIVAIALLVSLTSGRDVIYGHVRVGRGGKQFKCYKFRSMVRNSDQVLQDLLTSDPAAREEWERDFKLKNDPRITRIGRFIRKTSLDELPQLWNVLRGDMSVVGPRPVVEREFELYYHAARRHYLSVKPGLTGLWQVSGRNDVSYAERVSLDRRYVDNWNVLTDISIVLRTIRVMVSKSGAY